jgi:hypothetical protein
MPKAKASTKAKREAIAKAYGFNPFHPKEGVDDFYYSRRHLAKVEKANEHGWRDLKYQHAMMDLADAIEKELRIIRERDGVKYYREVAAGLIQAIESNVECHDGRKALRRLMDRGVVPGRVRLPLPVPMKERSTALRTSSSTSVTRKNDSPE